MQTLEDSLKAVLLDLMASCSSPEQAYTESIGVFEENCEDLHARAEDLANDLKKKGKTERYINLQMVPFRIAYDREMLCLHTTRKLQADGSNG